MLRKREHGVKERFRYVTEREKIMLVFVKNWETRGVRV